LRGYLAVADWHWIFGLAVPFAVLAAVGGWFSFPDTPRVSGPIDMAGAGLSAVTFGALLMALAGFGQGWPLAAVLATAATGIGATIILVRRMRGQSDPVLPVDLLRIRIFALSVTVSLCAFAAQMLTFVTLPFHLMNGLGLSTIQTGLILSGWPLAVALIAPVAGWVSDRAPPGILGAAGLLLMALSLTGMSAMPEGVEPLLIGVALAVGGLGFGLFQTPNNRAMMSVSPKTRSSAAGAALSTARLLGQALGTALAALALSGRLGEGAQAALAMGVAIAVLGALVSLTRGVARPGAT
jgi:DHA2 family multidrug resistance protein-like MFS transporter